MIKNLEEKFTAGETGIDFTVHWRVDDYVVEFAAYEIVTAHIEDKWGNVDTRPAYARKGEIGFDPTHDPSEAETYAHGRVKFDECSSFHLDEPHLCGRAAWQAHVDLVAYLWRRAGELLATNQIENGFRPLGQTGQA
jgi:hypothetical protein